jgi:hypothetical protein
MFRNKFFSNKGKKKLNRFFDLGVSTIIWEKVFRNKFFSNKGKKS